MLENALWHPVSAAKPLMAPTVSVLHWCLAKAVGSRSIEKLGDRDFFACWDGWSVKWHARSQDDPHLISDGEANVDQAAFSNLKKIAAGRKKLNDQSV